MPLRDVPGHWFACHFIIISNQINVEIINILLKSVSRLGLLLLVIIDKAPPSARGINEVARTLSRCCYPHTRSGEQ